MIAHCHGKEMGFLEPVSPGHAGETGPLNRRAGGSEGLSPFTQSETVIVLPETC